ncbi:MAG: tripartite tricarboxylate transporter substrate binding protein [Aeromicrobium sp.]|nr:tripartite tricarboxylate transporter substrate binding protein [Burkholderiales bacterium]
MNRRGFLLTAAAGALAARTTPTSALARWPAKPVKLVVPFAPGGGSDIIARLLAPKFLEMLQQPLLIENRPGASGTIGADVVAKAAPDGYTLLMSNNASIATAPLVYGKTPYQPVAGFVHVVMIGSFANGFLVRADHPAKSFPEFISLARQQPGRLTFASAGPGSAGHLTGELLKIRAGIDIQHVPYKGTGPAIVDLVSGQIDALFDGLPASLGYIRSGKLRSLAISSAKRLPALPNVPTINEHIPGVVGTAWFGISAPARTPQVIIESLQDAVQRCLAMLDLRARYAEIGVVPSGQGEREYTAFIEQEIAQWAPVIKAANVKAD